MTNILEKIQKLNFPKNQYIVVGAASLAVRNIREAKDLDILVAKELFNSLTKTWQIDETFLSKWKRRRFVRGDVEIYEDLYWSETGNVETLVDLLPHADYFSNIPFQSLEHLRACKLDTKRDKDFADIILIDSYLRTHAKS